MATGATFTTARTGNDERRTGSEGRVVVITGGGSGVGRATALALVHAGAIPVLLGRTVHPLSETLDLISEAGALVWRSRPMSPTRRQ